MIKKLVRAKNFHLERLPLRAFKKSVKFFQKLTSVLVLIMLLTVNNSAEESKHEFAKFKYEKHCATCHGLRGDLKGIKPIRLRMVPPPTNLVTGPYRYGCDEPALTKSTLKGIPDTSMDPFEDDLNHRHAKMISEMILEVIMKKDVRKKCVSVKAGEALHPKGVKATKKTAANTSQLLAPAVLARAKRSYQIRTGKLEFRAR